MNSLKPWQCALSFVWTSTIVSGIVTVIVFTLFDPADLIPIFMLDTTESAIRIQSYTILFLCFWLAMNGSCILNRYLNRVVNLSNPHAMNSIVKE